MVVSHLGFKVGNLVLIAPVPSHCFPFTEKFSAENCHATIFNICSVISDKPKTIAFMAQLSADMVIEPHGYIHRPIVFDQVSVNAGNAYNGYSGVFTAPYKASYYFSIDISSPPNSGSHSLHVHLLRNDQTIGYVFLNGHTQYWIRRTAAINVLLEIGDVVRAAVSRSAGSKPNTIAG